MFQTTTQGPQWFGPNVSLTVVNVSDCRTCHTRLSLIVVIPRGRLPYLRSPLAISRAPTGRPYHDPATHGLRAKGATCNSVGLLYRELPFGNPRDSPKHDA